MTNDCLSGFPPGIHVQLCNGVVHVGDQLLEQHTGHLCSNRVSVTPLIIGL